MRRSIVWYVLAVMVVPPALAMRAAWAQADLVAVSVFIVDRNVVGTLLQPNSPGWKSIVSGLRAARVLVCDPGGSVSCAPIPDDPVGSREDQIRDLLMTWRPKPNEHFRMPLTELWQLFQYGYDEVEGHWKSLNKTRFIDSERTIQFTIMSRPEIYLRINGGDSLTSEVPSASCLDRRVGNGEFKIARPPPTAIVSIETLLDNPVSQLSPEAQKVIAAIAGNVKDSTGGPSAAFRLMNPARLQCPGGMPAFVPPVVLNPDQGSCKVSEAPRMPMDGCPSSEPDRSPKVTPQNREPLPPKVADRSGDPALPNGIPRAPKPRDAPQPRAQSPAEPTPTPLKPASPWPEPLGPTVSAAPPPARSIVAQGTTITRPGAQSGPQMAAKWEDKGGAVIGTVRLEIAGPAPAGGAGNVLAAPVLNRTTATPGHYTVSMVVEGRPVACSEYPLRGRVIVSGIGGFVKDVEFVLLMCPNDSAVTIPMGGFDVP